MSGENNQMQLIDQESEDALYLNAEDRRKRYTSEQVKGLETKLDLVLALLGCQMPVDRVATLAHLSTRTVQALAAKHSAVIAENRAEYAGHLLRTGAEFLALARTKAQDAKFSELMVGAGICIQRGNEVGILGSSMDTDKITEADVVSDVRERVRKALEQAKPAPKIQTKEEVLCP